MPNYIDPLDLRRALDQGSKPIYLGNYSPYATAFGARNSYDARTNVYNAKPSNLVGYRAKLAAAVKGSALLRVFFSPGDSTYGGTTTGAGVRGSADIATNLAPMLATRLGLAATSPGTGIVPCTGAPVDSRWTLQAGWAAQDSNTYCKGTTLNATVTFASTPAVGTVVNVWYWNNSAAFSVNIDAAGPVTVTPPGGNGITQYQVTGLSNTTHSVVVTGTGASAGTPCYLVACEVGPASGITVSNHGASGTTTGDYVGQNTFPHKFYGPTQIGCDLAFIGLMINDWNTGITPATFQANYEAIIAMWKAAASNPNLVLTVPAQAQNGAATPVYAWSQYVSVIYALADAYDLPLVDFNHRWNDNWTQANTLGLQNGNTSPFHPTAAGYQDQASALLALLAP